jgi:hypothetical protein
LDTSRINIPANFIAFELVPSRAREGEVCGGDGQKRHEIVCGRTGTPARTLRVFFSLSPRKPRFSWRDRGHAPRTVCCCLTACPAHEPALGRLRVLALATRSLTAVSPAPPPRAKTCFSRRKGTRGGGSDWCGRSLGKQVKFPVADPLVRERLLSARLQHVAP